MRFPDAFVEGFKFSASGKVYNGNMRKLLKILENMSYSNIYIDIKAKRLQLSRAIDLERNSFTDHQPLMKSHKLYIFWNNYALIIDKRDWIGYVAKFGLSGVLV